MAKGKAGRNAGANQVARQFKKHGKGRQVKARQGRAKQWERQSKARGKEGQGKSQCKARVKAIQEASHGKAM
jgi:hypothetical protein